MYPLTIGLLVQNEAFAEQTESVLSKLPVRQVLEQKEIGDLTQLAEKVDRLRPNVVILDISALKGVEHEAVRKIRQTSAQPVIIVLNSVMTPDVILEVMRAGASEYLCPPFESALIAALEKVSNEFTVRDASNSANDVVAVFSAKGGCGSTTISCHVAAELARLTKKRTLIADFDLINGLVGFLMRTKSDYSVLDLTRNLYRLDQSYWEGVISNGLPGLSVMRAPASPLHGEMPSADELRQVLRFARSLYPWTIVDLGSGLNPGTVTLLEEANHIFMAVTLDITSLHRAKLAARDLLNGGVRKDRLKVILNRVSRNRELTNEEVEKMLGLEIYKMIPDDPAAVADAYADRKLVPSSSKLGGQFSRLAGKLAGIEAPSKKKFSLFG